MEKIIIFTDYFYPDPGNRSRRVLERSLHLIKEGFNVFVVCPCNENVEFGNYDYKNIKVFRVRPFLYNFMSSLSYQKYKNKNRLFNSMLPLFGFPRVIIPMLVCGYKINANLIYTMSNPVSLHMVGFILSFFDRKWVAELRDPIVGYEYSERGLLGKLFDRFFNTMLAMRANKVCMRVGLQTSSKRYSQLLGQRFSLLPDYGVDLKDYDTLTPHRFQGCSGNDCIKGVYAGGIYNADIKKVFSSFKNVRDKYSLNMDIHFYGPDYKIYKDSGFYKGYISYSELIQVYGSCNFVFLFDSSASKDSAINNFLPSKLCELVATRKPILYIGDVNSYSARLVRDNKIGVVSRDAEDAISEGFLSISDMVAFNTYNYNYYDQVKEEISNLHSEKEFAKVCRQAIAN